MATTTATVSISSSDLQPGNRLSINASSTLMKGGLTTGLTQMQTGVMSVATGAEHRISPLATEIAGDAHDIASFLYICNKSTDDTYWIDWGINDLMMGRLYAGDWMFIPWSAALDADEVEIEANTGTNDIEYAFFNSDVVLPTAA
tara:strand:- start:52 stop:486 length:435 start_codon:yes stop_codon:yes gene_type:complete